MKNFKIETSISISEDSECLEGLKFILSKLKKVLRKPYKWKWVIIALHNTLQNFMVYAIRDTAGINILKKNIQESFAEALKNNTERPVEKLNYFLALYEDIKTHEDIYFEQKKFIPIDRQDENIKYLNEVRNDLIHFIPGGWLFDCKNKPDVVIDCIDLIEYLMDKSSNVRILIQNDKQIYKLITKIRIVAEDIKNRYKDC